MSKPELITLGLLKVTISGDWTIRMKTEFRILIYVTKMGIIYLLTSPGGNQYIGKTKKTFEHRMYQHGQDAACGRDRCPRLHCAIRHHGWEHFKKEILINCPDDELSAREIELIEKYNTMWPNGYNLTPGDDGNGAPHTEEYKEVKSQQMRKLAVDENLPMYVKYKTTALGTTGYCVQRPGFPYAQFCQSELSMEEKKKMAIEHNEALIRGENPEINRYKHVDLGFEIPKHISYLSKFDGFRVDKPGHPKGYFKSRRMTCEEKFEKAVAYLNTLNP